MIRQTFGTSRGGLTFNHVDLNRLDADAGALQVLRRYSVFDVAPAYANCQPHRNKQYRV